jgi:hypothetical protein
MTSNHSYGVAFLDAVLTPHGLAGAWCYLAEDGSSHGMTRLELTDRIAQSDLYPTSATSTGFQSSVLAGTRR